MLPNKNKNDSSYEEVEEDSLELKVIDIINIFQFLPNKEVRKKKAKYVVMEAHNSH